VGPSQDEFQSAVGMLKLLGDETRLRIIWALLDGEHSVNELAALVGAHPTYYVADDAHVRRLVEEVLSHADHVTRAAPETTGRSDDSRS
jgi:DNA-binding transcriptional ArsR family regulator